MHAMSAAGEPAQPCSAKPIRSCDQQVTRDVRCISKLSLSLCVNPSAHISCHLADILLFVHQGLTGLTQSMPCISSRKPLECSIFSCIQSWKQTNNLCSNAKLSRKAILQQIECTQAGPKVKPVLHMLMQHLCNCMKLYTPQ